jgi:hypothetical protein
MVHSDMLPPKQRPALDGQTVLPYRDMPDWKNAPERLKLQKYWGIYLLRHVPTNSYYVGYSTDAAKAYYSWYWRLKDLKQKPSLNWAMLSTYTKREDYEFILMHWSTDFYATVHRSAQQKMIDATLEKLTRNILTQMGRDKLLNCSNSLDDQAYWINRTPKDERSWRFACRQAGTRKRGKPIVRKAAPVVH